MSSTSMSPSTSSPATLPRTAQPCLLFDLDGTLIDGVPDLLTAINEVLQAHGLPGLQRPALEAMLGDGMRVLVQRAFAAFGRELEPAAYEAACAAYVAAYRATDYRHTRLYEGVAETLAELQQQGWRIGLASNKPTAPCEAILERLGIRSCFSVVAGGDATSVRKPDPQHLRFALQQMGQDPDQARAVMVGDHANDVNAARGAGLKAVAVAFETDPGRAHSLGADAVVTHFPALPAVLATLV